MIRNKEKSSLEASSTDSDQLQIETVTLLKGMYASSTRHLCIFRHKILIYYYYKIDNRQKPNDVTVIVTINKYFITTNGIQRITDGAWLSDEVCVQCVFVPVYCIIVYSIIGD